jgi:exodeoxyribonuclease VII small subunit
MTERASPTSSNAAEPSFEAIVARLEAIASKLEAGDAKLEEALALFEEGVKLSKRGAGRLDAAERKLEVLLESGQTEALPEGQVAPPPIDR